MEGAAFLALAALLAYTLAGYPILMAALGAVRRRPVARDQAVREIAVVIPVHDAEAELEAKLDNCLRLDYPPDAYRVWVVSDGSTDRTVEIAGRYRDRGVRCLAIPERVGKVAAQNRVLPMLREPIWVFTDVSVRVAPDALRLVSGNFADPTVGVVSCRDEVDPEGGTGLGERLYILYDMAARYALRGAGSLVGVTGGFYAVRRELAAEPWEPAHPPDFFIALRAIERGMRVVEDDRLRARYRAPGAAGGEYARKVRTITRGMWALWDHRRLLDPVRYGLVAVELLSHKLLRWTLPFQLLALLAVSAWAAWTHPRNAAWTALVLAQGAAYAAGGWACARSRPGGRRGERLWGALGYVVLVNAAILHSWFNLLRGRRYVVWEPTRRAAEAARAGAPRTRS